MPPRSRDRRASSGRKASRLGIESLETRRLLSGDAASVVSAIAQEVDTTSTDAVVATSSITTTTASDTSTIQDDTPIALPSTPANEVIAYSQAVSQATSTSNSNKPDLVATAFTTSGNLDWDQQFQAVGTLKNQGNTSTAAPFKVDVFAAPDLNAVDNSMLAGSFVVPAGLAAGASYDFNVTMFTPGRPNTVLASKPSYYMRLAIDVTNAVPESNEANNVSNGLQGVDTAVVTVTPRLPSKLVPAGLAVSSGVLDWGGTMKVVATVRNEGAGNAPATNARIVLAPYGENPFGPRGYTIGSVAIPQVGAFQTMSANQDIQLPQYPPTTLANVGKFLVVMVTDADGAADPVFKPTGYQGAGVDWTTAQITPKPAPVKAADLPDLSVSALTTPSVATWDQTLQMTARIENLGKSNAGGFKVRFLLVQSDAANAPALNLGDVTVDSLKVGESREVSKTLKLPAQVPAGLSANATTGRIVARIDPDRSIDESRIDNNQLASLPITLKLVGNGVASPLVTTTPQDTTSQTPTTTKTPQSSGQQNARAAALARRAHAIQVRQAAARERHAKQLAAAAERAKHLKIYPRPAATRARTAMVKILPIRDASEGDSSTNQSA